MQIKVTELIWSELNFSNYKNYLTYTRSREYYILQWNGLSTKSTDQEKAMI